MSDDVTFVMDMQGGEEILTQMAAATVQQSAEAIAARANSMANTMSSNPPEISVSTRVGVIKRGTRAIATVTAVGTDAHSNYIGHQALTKAKDAGRV